MRFSSPISSLFPCFLILVGCSGAESPSDVAGSGGAGSDGSGGASPFAGGTTGFGGQPSAGGSAAIGGSQPSGGGPSMGGQQTSGGSSSGGASTGGSASGGRNSSGGASSGGAAIGGGSSGGAGSGGAGSGGAGSGGAGAGGGPIELDCDASMPTTGAVLHQGNERDGEGNLAWEIWSNTGLGDLTSYDVPAFIGSWDEAGGYLGRIGFEWGDFGDTPKPYEEHGTITAQFVSNKSGTGGQYSYVGMYGWSTEPCVEWYVIDDSFNTMPVNPGTTTLEGEVDLDDGTYLMYTRPTSGSGGTRCEGETNWIQYYSIRTTARRCGQISLTEHFDAWKTLGMNLGVILEAKIIVEVGGGTGSVEFPIANVMTTQ